MYQVLVVYAVVWVKGSHRDGKSPGVFSQNIGMYRHNIVSMEHSFYMSYYPHQMCPPGQFDVPNYSTCPLTPWPHPDPSQPPHCQQVTISSHYCDMIHTDGSLILQCDITAKNGRYIHLQITLTVVHGLKTIVKGDVDSKSTSLDCNASNKKDTSKNGSQCPEEKHGKTRYIVPMG